MQEIWQKKKRFFINWIGSWNFTGLHSLITTRWFKYMYICLFEQPTCKWAGQTVQVIRSCSHEDFSSPLQCNRLQGHVGKIAKEINEAQFPRFTTWHWVALLHYTTFHCQSMNCLVMPRCRGRNCGGNKREIALSHVHASPEPQFKTALACHHSTTHSTF